MRSAWICTRNVVLSNLAVLLAAAGVFGRGAGLPDIIVAIIPLVCLSDTKRISDHA
jgi:hypothetical protein